VGEIDTNTNTQMRVYRQTSGYNSADYPILVSRTATTDIGTAGTNSSYSGVYAVIGQNGTYTPTINPHTGLIVAKGNVKFPAGVGSTTNPVYINASTGLITATGLDLSPITDAMIYEITGYTAADLA